VSVFVNFSIGASNSNERVNGHDNMGFMKARLMKPAVLVLILLFSIVSVAASMRLRRQEQDTLKVEVALVNVQVSVVDKRGRFVPDLKKEDFLIEEDGRKQEIRNFSRENELPLTLALLIDTSPSVRPVFEEEKHTAESFLQSILRPKDLALVMGFDREVELVQDYTDSPRQLIRAIDSLEIGGGTSVYDAIYLACKEKLAEEAGRKAIIMMSDGEDTTSKLRLQEALVAAHRSDAVFYGIFNAANSSFSIGPYGRRPPGGVFGGGGDIGTLRKFSEETGGTTFSISRENSFEKIFNQIAEELRSQYSLGYVSTNTAKDGKYRQIKVVARGSGYMVKARKGYYAAKSSEH
jgi:VWFA-related protein